MEYPALNASTIKQVAFPEDQYVKVIQAKKQIVLHHTASGPGVEGDIKTWEGDVRKVATCVIVDRSGLIYKCFEAGYWAGHINIVSKGNLVKPELKKYLTVPNNTSLDKGSIGIEIDAWGPLQLKDGKFLSWVGTNVPKEDVIEYPNLFRGERFYHKYSDAQILSVAQLLKLWGNTYKIPLNYNAEMWEPCEKALSGQAGIFSHVSYRVDKSDCHPQPNLISMLKSLS